jgi:error-prone DNA polymerase
MEKFHKEVMGTRPIEIEGVIQSSPDRVVHLVADCLLRGSYIRKTRPIQ